MTLQAGRVVKCVFYKHPRPWSLEGHIKKAKNTVNLVTMIWAFCLAIVVGFGCMGV
jgi:hypothetical protein